MAKKYVIGNWKTHPITYKEASQIFRGIVKALPRGGSVEIGICPPDIFIEPLTKLYRGKRIAFGAQNCARFITGSHTGETLPTMLRGLGIQYVVLGHSERRGEGETSKEVSEKIQGALKSRLTPIVCFGERDRDMHGEYLQVLAEQLRETLMGVSAAQIKKCILAYEPVWAIGKSAADALDANGVHQTMLYIRKVLVDMYGRNVGMKVRILYGGSVEPANADALIEESDGFLVGHASLVPEDFTTIIKTVVQHT